MAFDVYEYGAIAVFVFVVVFFVVFYPMVTGNTISLNTSYERDYGYQFFVNKTSLTLLSTTTTSSTTTSTLRFSFLNSSGVPSLVFNTDNGGILLNCGSDPAVMDKIYMSGIGKIYAAYMSNLDEAHIGGCPRTFISMMPIAVFDDGSNKSDIWFRNYVYVLGNHRYEFGKRNPLLVSGLESRMLWTDGGNSVFRFRFGNITIFYLSGCDGCFEKVASAGNNMYLIDKEISEDLIISKQPKYIVMHNSSSGFEGLCRKYGVALYVLSNGGDATFTTNGNSVEPIKK